MINKMLGSASLLALSVSVNAATGVLQVYDPAGALMQNDTSVSASIVYSGSGSSISSPTPFFGANWTAHDITICQEGECPAVNVGPGQIGMSMLLDWGATTNMYLENVWDVSESGGVVTYTIVDSDGDGIPGDAFDNGPFPGFSWNYNLVGSDLPTAFNSPDITLNGASILNLQVGDTYIDAGATATDVEDGDLTSSIVVTNPVDTSIAATYTVTYSVIDSDSHTTIASRTVIVTQGDFPVIALNSVSPVTVYTLDAYVDAGATANDTEDGNITASIVTTSNVNTSVAGSYTVSYSITDSAGNNAVAIRDVNVITGDTPVIAINGLANVSLNMGETYVDAGATANDTEDGDLTGSINVSNSVNTSIAGVYSVTYNLTDSNGNSAIQKTRTVEVIDPSVVSGNFTMLDPTGALVGTDDTVTASIVYPGSGSSISTLQPFFGLFWYAHDVTTYQNGTYTVNTSTGGTYTFTVGVGQIGMHMLIDWGSVTGLDVVNVWDVSESAGVRSYTESDWDGDGIVGGAMIEGPFPGFSWNINLTGAALPPVDNSPALTLNDFSPVQLQTGDVYIDAGATASDAEDGDLTASIVVTNPVDTSISGTYTVTYSVTDSDSNTTTATRTVVVIQGEFPVIILNGVSPVTIYTQTAYVDAGAIASDAEDGGVTASIITTGTVDTSFEGVYTVTYTVTDSDGNTTVATREVNVIYGDIPVITLIGNAAVSLAVGEVYIDEGATASDTEDGNLTAGIIINNSVDTSVAGTYTVTYDVTDSNGNAAAGVERTVEIIDPSVVGGMLQVYDPTGAPMTFDNSVTASIVYPGSGSTIASTTPFFGTLWYIHDITTYAAGTHTVGGYTFTVGAGQMGAHLLIDWGANSNIGVVTIWDVTESSGVVYYTTADGNGDGIPGIPMNNGPFPGFNWAVDLAGSGLPMVENIPAITLNGASTVTLNAGNAYSDAGATATDVEDGDLTASIMVTNPVDTSIAGTYTVTYSVTDSGSNTVTATRTVIVTQGQFPVITLNGISPDTVYITEAYVDAGAMANDTEDGDITANIVTTSTLDTSIAGSYLITYSVTDAHGNTSSVTRDINVIQGDIPVIALTGNASVTLALDASYVDAGATASDTEDGNLTASIMVTGSVNTSMPGTYSVNYNVTDSHGNAAGQVTRTVKVVDPNQVSGEFALYDPTGLVVGVVDSAVVATIQYPGSGSALSSETPFFGQNWYTHDITTYSAGTYTIDTIEGGSFTFTVGFGQIGVHMLFDWAATTNIDVVNVWDITESAGIVTYTSTDWDGDGILGGQMVDGPFPGFSANFDLTGAALVTPANVPPIVALVGSSTVNVLAGDTYIDAGATASDAEDGDISANIVTASTVNTSIPGIYSVTYDVTDSFGDSASVTRTVIVTMGYIPVITLNGTSSVTLTTGSSFIDDGAIATDTEDGDLTSSIIVNNNVDTSMPGTYLVQYNVTDSHGNDADEVVRTVEVVVELPVVGAAEFCVYDPTGLDVGVCDNTVTANIVYPGSGSTISSETPFFGFTWTAHDITTYTPGTYTVETGSGPYTFTVGPGQVGAHILFDWSQNTDIDVVIVWDVTVSGEDIIYTSTDWDGDGVLGGQMIDGPFYGFSASFDVTSPYVSAAGNVPLINLVGDATVLVNVDDVYTDAGAMATDAEDGDLSGSIAITGLVDTSVASTYVLSYSVTDSDGNTASVSRTVIVNYLDSDEDGVLLSNDNCSVVANPNQRDTDGDGFGNFCDADLNNDNIVNAIDLGMFRQRYFSTNADADFNGDGIVNAIDLGMFRSMYGSQPGPSGLN